MKREKYILTSLAFLIFMPYMALCNHVVTLRTGQATEINTALITSHGSNFGTARIRFNYNTNSSGQHIVEMEVVATIGQNRIMVFDRSGDVSSVRNTINRINPKFSISSSFLREIAREIEAIKPFLSARPEALRLKENFSVGAFSFNTFMRFPLLLEPGSMTNERMVRITINMYGVEGNQLSYALSPIEIELNFPGLDLTPPATGSIATRGGTDRPDSGTGQWQCQWMLEELGDSIAAQESRWAGYNMEARMQNFSRRYQEIETGQITSTDVRSREEYYRQAQALLTEVNSATRILYLTRLAYDSLLMQMDYLPVECNTLPYEERLKANLAGVRQQRQIIDSLNASVQEVMRLLDAETTHKIDSLNQSLLPIFARLNHELTELETNYALLRNEFDLMKVSPRYFTRHQRRFDNQTAALMDSLALLQQRYEQYQAEAQKTFAELWGMEQPLWSDELRRLLQNFGTGRQVLTGRLDQISEDIATYPPRAFPWVLASIIVLLAAMVVFGIVMLAISISAKAKKEKNETLSGQYDTEQHSDEPEYSQQQNNNDTPQSRIKI